MPSPRTDIMIPRRFQRLTKRSPPIGTRGGRMITSHPPLEGEGVTKQTPPHLRLMTACVPDQLNRRLT